MTRRITRENRRKVEAKTVYMHLLHPVAETIHDHAAYGGMIGVERVPGTTVVGVARAILFKDVVSAVIDSAKTDSGPSVVAFGRVIEYDIENDFDSRPVQSFDHVAKLVDRPEWVLPSSNTLDVAKKKRPAHIPNSW